LLHAITVKSFFISTAYDPRRAMGHMTAPEPTFEMRRDPKSMDAC
jgi:hypothetical protein